MFAVQWTAATDLLFTSTCELASGDVRCIHFLRGRPSPSRPNFSPWHHKMNWLICWPHSPPVRAYVCTTTLTDPQGIRARTTDDFWPILGCSEMAKIFLPTCTSTGHMRPFFDLLFSSSFACKCLCWGGCHLQPEEALGVSHRRLTSRFDASSCRIRGSATS